MAKDFWTDSGFKNTVIDNEGKKRFIFNDHMIIKNILWSNYIGFKDFYSEFIIKYSRGKSTEVESYGMRRCMLILISEILNYKNHNSSKVSKKSDNLILHLYLTNADVMELERLKESIMNNRYVVKADFDFCFNVFTSFMFKSGVSNLTVEGATDTLTDLY